MKKLFLILLTMGTLLGCNDKADDKKNIVYKFPERIVSLTLSGDEMVLSLADNNKIKALSGKIAEDGRYSNIVEKAKQYPKAENNMEFVLSMKPDFILASSWVSKDIIQSYKDFGINVFTYDIPITIEEQMNNLQKLGEVLGSEEKSLELINSQKEKLKYLEQKLSAVKDKKRVLYYTTDGFTSGKGTTIDDILNKAKTVNLASEMGIVGFKSLSKETIIDINPEVIIISGTSSKIGKAEIEERFIKDVSLRNVEAVKNHKIYMIEDRHMTTISQSMIKGLEDLIDVIYPELKVKDVG